MSLFEFSLPKRLLLLVALVPCQVLRAIDPGTPIHQFAREAWNQQQGLTGTAVYGIQQLKDDYLWLNTSAGLIRFDGARFVVIHPAVEGVPVTESMSTLAAAPNGKLLLRGRTETLTLDSGSFSRRTPTFALPDGKARVVHESPSGAIWIGADNQIFRIQGDNFEFLAQDVSWVNAIEDSPDGSTWFATNNGLYAFENANARYFPAKGYKQHPDIRLPHQVVESSILEGPGNCTALLALDKDTMLVGSVKGLWKLKDGRFFQDNETSGCGPVSITSLMREKNGALWIGTDGAGLFRFANGRWDHFSNSDGLGDQSVLSIAEDKEGSIWVGTRSGLVRFRESIFKTITEEDGLCSDTTWTVLEGKDGALYVGTASAGVTRIKDGKTKKFGVQEGLPHEAGGALFEDSQGRLCISTDQGLCIVDGDKATTYTAEGVLSGVYLPAVAEDSGKLLLARGDRNLYWFENDRVTPANVRMAASSGPQSVRYVWHMHRDREGTLWLAMSGGLYRLPAGAPPEAAEPTAITWLVNSIGEDDRGHLWLASTEQSGFTRLTKKNGAVDRFPAEIGAKVDGIARIVTDQDGNVWMNTRSGIASYSRVDLDDYVAGKRKTVNGRYYGMLDGLRTPECGLVGPQPAAWAGQDGKLYFTSRKGLVILDPRQIPQNTQIPTVRVEETVVDGKVFPESHPVTVTSGAEHIEVHFTALSLRVPSRVLFKYKLLGYDSDWSEPGTGRSAVFTKLPPGNYEFQVLASNDSGLWTTAPAKLTLTIVPRFFQTRWFTMGAILSGFLLIYFVFKLRLRQLHARQETLHRLVEDRTRELKNEVNERVEAEKALLDVREHLERTVSERTRQVEQKIKDLEESEGRLRQSQKLEGIGKLAGGVAHDFNNLLTVINGYCDFWITDPGMPDESKLYAREIKQAGTRAASLTQQLLAFSRKQVLQLEQIDLNPLVADMERLLRRLLPENITFITRLCEKPCLILVDPGQINQVILNLVVNARDALPDGGKIVVESTWVEIDSSHFANRPEVKAGHYVQLNVTDTGAGMDKATLGRIFEPFFTTKELGKGTGLGLSTVFGIVKQSEGHIFVDSELGCGSSFRILLPRLEGAQPSAINTKPPMPATAFSGGTVLIAEDQEDVRLLARKILLKKGYTVLEAASGPAALELAQTTKVSIDILFTDLVMPGMSGKELAQRMKALRPGISVVYTSGYMEDAVIQMGATDPGFTLLLKPFNADQLLQTIAKTLDERARLLGPSGEER